MNDQIIMNDINLLRSHSIEAIKVIERLQKHLDITSDHKKKTGLSDEQKANFLAKKNKNKI